MFATVCRTIRLLQNSIGQLTRVQARCFPRLALGAMGFFPVPAVPTKIVRPNARFGHFRNVVLAHAKVGAGTGTRDAVLDASRSTMTRDAIVGMIASSHMGLRCSVMFVFRMSTTKARRG